MKDFKFQIPTNSRLRLQLTRPTCARQGRCGRVADMFNFKCGNKKSSQAGFSIVYLVVAIFVFSLVLLSILQYALTQFKIVRSTANREQAFQIAEAGINYYQWYLAHFPSDYWDGNASTTPGPYIHNYTDFDQQTVLGKFELTITPPSVGSTVVTIKSKGYTIENPKQSRTITVRYGIPSLAKYGFLTNESVWIGQGENISGQMHANGGIRFDGTGNAPITSAKNTYSCLSWSGSPCPTTKPGIWGAAASSTQAFWQFPVPSIVFSSMTSDLNNMKSMASSDGAPAYLGPSNNKGYSLVFKPNGTVDIYIVKKLLNAPSSTYNVNMAPVSQSIDYDPNASQRQLIYSNVPIPARGIFFLQDHVWVEGTVKGRVTVVAAVPGATSNYPNIIIPNNILYAGSSGSDSLGLIGQGNVLVAYNAPTDLTINAAMIAQNGSIQVYYYASGANIKNSITVNGSLATYGQWTWTYVSGGGNVVSGFRNTYTNYDGNLLYAPPPSFPLSTDGYQQISWTSD